MTELFYTAAFGLPVILLIVYLTRPAPPEFGTITDEEFAAAIEEMDSLYANNAEAGSDPRVR